MVPIESRARPEEGVPAPHVPRCLFEERVVPEQAVPRHACPNHTGEVRDDGQEGEDGQGNGLSIRRVRIALARASASPRTPILEARQHTRAMPGSW